MTPGQPAPPRPGTLGVWWAAIRPRTLGMALAPVALGTALAIADGVELAWAVLFATAACALLIQIGKEQRLRLRVMRVVGRCDRG